MPSIENLLSFRISVNKLLHFSLRLKTKIHFQSKVLAFLTQNKSDTFEQSSCLKVSDLFVINDSALTSKLIAFTSKRAYTYFLFVSDSAYIILKRTEFHRAFFRYLFRLTDNWLIVNFDSHFKTNHGQFQSG